MRNCKLFYLLAEGGLGRIPELLLVRAISAAVPTLGVSVFFPCRSWPDASVCERYSN